MPKTKISEYDVAASNTDIGGINLSEGVMVPSDINNAIREQMAHLKDFSDGTSGIDVLNLHDDDASASIKLQAPAAVTTTTTLTLPDGAGSVGQALATDGSGTLSWTKVAEANLDVSGTGTAGQAVVSDGSGAFEFSTISSYPQVITTLTSGTSYTIPANAQAILIKASGGGGGGSVHANPATGGLGLNSVTVGGDGGATTVTNSTLSISITAPGGPHGTNMGAGADTTNWFTNVGSSSTGGDIFYNAGASGGRTTTNNFDGQSQDGGNGVLVQKYVTGASVGGEVLTYALGAGGTATTNGGSIQPEAGRDGYIELWIW
jgi:hypothetical protein